MRDFTDRERFIYIVTVMKASSLAKVQPIAVIQGLIEFLRKNLCPSLTMDDWIEIEQNVIKMNALTVEVQKEGFYKSLGMKIPNPNKPRDLKGIKDLEDAVASEIKNVDMTKLEESLPDQYKYIEELKEKLKLIYHRDEG